MENIAGGYGSEGKPQPHAMETMCKNPMAILLHYADGLKATVCSDARSVALDYRILVQA
eukprot:COSAG02_NODE_159_length_32891_cov_17.822518_3_plen_59_part_00